MQKQCKKHGITEGYLVEGKRVRCKKCRSEAVTKRRRQIKMNLSQNAGGKCYIYQYDKCVQALQFHHIDPRQKEFSIGANGLCRSMDKMQKEAEKCVLLCANCHAEVENGITELILA